MPFCVFEDEISDIYSMGINNVIEMRGWGNCIFSPLPGVERETNLQRGWGSASVSQRKISRDPGLQITIDNPKKRHIQPFGPVLLYNCHDLYTVAGETTKKPSIASSL